MSWITSGKLDAVLDIKFPRHPDEEVDLTAILNHLGKNVAEIAKESTGTGRGRYHSWSTSSRSASVACARDRNDLDRILGLDR
jgi:hypothetical protein